MEKRVEVIESCYTPKDPGVSDWKGMFPTPVACCKRMGKIEKTINPTNFAGGFLLGLLGYYT